MEEFSGLGSILVGWLHRWRAARRNSREALDEEMRFHLEESIAAKVDAGMEPHAARQAVMVEFGGVEGNREEAYRMRPGWWLELLWLDAKYALRGFRRAPAFAVTAILTLALAIGATTAVFSVVDRILFRALPYRDADRLVSIGLTHALEKQEFMLGGIFYEWRDNQKPFVEMAAQNTGPHACNLGGNGLGGNEPVQLNCVLFQQRLLPMLGVTPVLGRNFLPEEGLAHGPAVALLSYGAWKEHFGGDVGILNRLITVDDVPTRVVGVLPREFVLPTLQDADLVMPMVLAPAADQHGQNGGMGQPMRAFARMKPGISIEQARAQMEPLFRHTLETVVPPPVRKDVRLGLRSVRDRQVQDVRQMAWVMMGSVLAVLLIACANVASLMVARGVARRRELAIRSALGASRGRVARQALVEALLLALGGGILGLGLAMGLVRAFIALAPASVPYLDRVGLDLRISCFALLLSAGCGCLFGLAPVLEKPMALAVVSRVRGTRRDGLLRRVMVMGQIAVSMILLAGALLLVRSFRNLETQKLGMEAGGVMTVEMAPTATAHDGPVGGMVSRKGAGQAGVFLRAEEAVRALPGVRAVGWSDSVPPGGGFQDARPISNFAVDGGEVDGGEPVEGDMSPVRFRGVTPDYFRVLRIPMVRGQGFTEEEREGKQHWLVLSRLAAARLFGTKDPVGRAIAMGQTRDPYIVAGVAENVRNGGLSEPDVPEAYWLRRNEGDDWGSPTPRMVIATDLAPGVVAPWIRAQMAQVSPGTPIKVETLSAQLSKLADRPRFVTALLGFFALTGVLIAVIGLYGVTSYLAAQRTQEIGVRMALGADREGILRLIAREGVLLIVVGGAIGVTGALSLTRLLGSLLFGVGPRDPLALGLAVGLLAMVALVATMIPARRAMRVDPVEALRQE